MEDRKEREGGREGGRREVNRPNGTLSPLTSLPERGRRGREGGGGDYRHNGRREVTRLNGTLLPPISRRQKK